MKRLIAGAALAVAFMLAGCASHAAVKPGSTITLSLDEAGNKAVDPDGQKVLDALKMIESGRIQLAVDGPLAEVIAKYETRYAGKSGKVFCAEGMLDALVYATMAATDKTSGGKADAPVEVIGPAWAKAYWARGYAYSEMGRYADARVELEKALALSPMNSQYKSELAFTYERSQDWGKMLALYKEAQDAAAISGDPEHAPDLECVALRGQGYALVELRRLDEATTAYQDCLKLRPDEPRSVAELGYIKDLRAKSH